MRKLVAVLAMLAFGFAVYKTIGALRSGAAEAAASPVATTHRADYQLPGTMYLAQSGWLYRLAGGTFTQLHPAQAGQWQQPAFSPDGSYLLAVDRSVQFSDVYQLGLDGHLIRQLTNNKSVRGSLAHWAFYPRLSPDGASLYYSYDGPKYYGDFRVDLAVWSMLLSSNQRSARRQSTFNDYTGGDTFPIPLTGAGLLYSKYDIDTTGPFSQLWYQVRTLSLGKALTQPDDDCGQPALSPDGSRVAMICSSRQQAGRLEVATFDGAGNLGPLQVVVNAGLNASPAWSPDGKTLAYLAPAGKQRHFQLWTVSMPVAGLAGPPRQVTTDLDFDATSPPAWR